jgi:O-acetyl-ADP-ribose deacetylase (regulator of RNase III)
MNRSSLGILVVSFAASLSAHAQMMETNFFNKIFPKNPVSMKSNNDACFVKATKMLPRGAALITESGEMAQNGIIAVIHAASGAMTKSGGVYEPTTDSVKSSIRNSLILARKFKHRRVAIPFIGGGIFASRMGVTKEELAEIIVGASLQYKKQLEVVFVLFSAAEEKMFNETLERKRQDPKSTIDALNASVVKGSITDFSVHGASAIVNAANMEVAFGGGISGAIGSATGKADEIDSKAEELIEIVGRNCFLDEVETQVEEDEMFDEE